MEYLTNEKLVIIGGGGMIGSNMLQTALMLQLTDNIMVYDPYLPSLEGAVEEMNHCGFEDVEIQFSNDIQEALKDASYIVSSGGAARKAGMTREDLLKGNAEIAAQLGKDIKVYCPTVKHVCIVFNPADITGLITLIYSGLNPNQLSTLAALDSTRLQTELAKHLGIRKNVIKNPRTYGGHGEQMAVYSSTCTVDGTALDALIEEGKISSEDWKNIQQKVTQGGKKIIELRGRSSFQSPAYLSIKMIEAAMGGQTFELPAGAYINEGDFKNILMALDTKITKNGLSIALPKGTKKETDALKHSYQHLCKLRDEVIEMGILPTIKDWSTINSNL